MGIWRVHSSAGYLAFTRPNNTFDEFLIIKQCLFFMFPWETLYYIKSESQLLLLGRDKCKYLIKETQAFLFPSFHPFFFSSLPFFVPNFSHFWVKSEIVFKSYEYSSIFKMQKYLNI